MYRKRYTHIIYEDNYVLEDAYNIIKIYNIDSIKMLSRFIYIINMD